jgi:VIT1/CCC1 family predicted Fe2+/Mn2+ transporter
MRAQAELIEHELAVERRALARNPEFEIRELIGIYRRRGIDRETAEQMATQVMADPEQALEVHAREEMGVDPSSLGSPFQAAASSFGTFAVGAAIPLAPWLFDRGGGAIVASLVLAAVAAIAVGAALSRFTRRGITRSAARQLAILAVAAGVTYAIGAAVGAH